MKESTIEDLVYDIRRAKKNPIFVLGAGASVSGDIPLANNIADNIIEEYADNPRIKNLSPTDKKNYAKLMECLSPDDRCELLKGYINDAKINVTHIYLAQLMSQDHVDYILTVNFDNLMLRALALFNKFPPTHDMAILKELPTTTIDKKSIVYLHGRHHGTSQLNTENEMSGIEKPTKSILDSIKNGRPWVFIGYSGADPFFDRIKELGRFDNHLYWVGYHDQEPERNVKEFLDTNDTTFYIKGYDADAFMLKLNEKLGLEQPDILNKPFSVLQSMLGQINDIDSHEQYRGVKQRQELATKNVKKAIQQFEEGENVPINETEQQSDQLKKDIINVLISEKYDEKHIKSLEETANRIKDEEINTLLSSLYYNWGNALGHLAQITAEEDTQQAQQLYIQACRKYEKATKIKPDFHEAFYNWGNALTNLAQDKTEDEAEQLYSQAFEKYETAIKYDGKHYNLSCLYAIRKNKKKALEVLDKSLSNNEIDVTFVENDKDWAHYLDDVDFINILKKYK